MIQGVRFGSALDGAEYKLAEVEAVFTTGISLSMVPSSVSKDFFKKLLSGTTAYEKNGIFYAKCDDKFDDVWFMFEYHWI